MDSLAPKDRDFDCDLESGGQSLGGESPSSVKKQKARTLLDKVCGGFVDGLNKGGNGISVFENVLNCDGALVEKLEVVTVKKVDGAQNIGSAERKSPKDKRKSTSSKKPPKPPRPPKGPSLDSADQKLIKEIAELAMMKRARNERMKAIKKMKAAKASSSSSGNMLAMIFTALFCLVIIFQGVSSSSPSSSFLGPPLSAGQENGGLISVQYYPNPSVSVPNGPSSESPAFLKQVAGSDPTQEQWRKIG